METNLIESKNTTKVGIKAVIKSAIKSTITIAANVAGGLATLLIYQKGAPRMG